MGTRKAMPAERRMGAAEMFARDWLDAREENNVVMDLLFKCALSGVG